MTEGSWDGLCAELRRYANAFGGEGADTLRTAAMTIERYGNGLLSIAYGEEPRQAGKKWRADGVASKHDQCAHGRWYYEDCGQCTADYANSILALAAGTRSAETSETSAPSEGCQSGPKGNAQKEAR